MWNGKGLGAGTKGLLLGLALYSSPLGRFRWPGKEYLAEKLEVTPDLVDAALKKARDKGYLKMYRDMSRGLLAYCPTLPHPGSSQVVEALRFPSGDDNLTIKAPASLTEKLVLLALSDRKCRNCGQECTHVDDVLNLINEAR